ncbi:MAG: hypothetical protein L6R41_002751 [Letrouitia leprolyta]|nr:MAG: hypothetical protein L6R41_002751 [Letrouitia leprolyta]
MQIESLPKTVDMSIHDRARDVFFFKYVCSFSQPADIPGLLWMQSSDDMHLRASMDAASLAFFSFHHDSTEACLLARKQYLVALPQVNRALQSPERASSNSTFLAVILLDLFEKTMHDVSRSDDPLMSHLNGALALVKLRGPQNFQEDTGLQLSTLLSTHILMSCVTAHKRVPQGLIQLRSDLERFIDRREPKWQATDLVIKYNHLRCDVEEGRIPESTASSRVLDLDREIREFAESMLPMTGYATKTLAKPCARAFEKHYDLYPNHAATQLWNIFRVIRILLNDLKHQHDVEDVPKAYLGVMNKDSIMGAQTVDSLAKEICASVYQYTHKNDGSEMMHFQEVQKARCYTLIYPLYVAAVHAGQSTGIRTWAMKQLSFLSGTVGIRQARQVEDILAKGDDPDPWSIYAMLGSYAFAVWR